MFFSYQKVIGLTLQGKVHTWKPHIVVGVNSDRQVLLQLPSHIAYSPAWQGELHDKLRPDWTTERGNVHVA